MFNLRTHHKTDWELLIHLFSRLRHWSEIESSLPVIYPDSNRLERYGARLPRSQVKRSRFEGDSQLSSNPGMLNYSEATMVLVVVERSYEPPLTEAVMQDADERTLPCLQEREANWCFSWLASDRRRMVCTFEAPRSRLDSRNSETLEMRCWIDSGQKSKWL